VSRSVSGGAVKLAVELSSQGNENALSFSLSFDPAVLRNPRATPGVDGSTAQLNINTSQASAGRLGLLLALPSGQSFAVGDRELLLVDFDVMPSVEATTIDFSDQPIPREILDIGTNSLAATWTPATINLPVGYEADVAPRPFGSRDGTITIEDWIQAGRFIAVLDTPQTASNEFQRIDCSPRACGDGRLSLADWVQAGRYAAGFDTVTAACGPNNVITDLSAYTTQNSTSARMISAQNDTFISGQNGSLLITLAADGSENAFGFSLNYDADLLTFLNVSLGANATDATLYVNDRNKSNGRIGVILALPAGQIFSINDRQLLLVNFAAKPNTNIVTTVTFDDAVIVREAVDVDANTLPTAWSAATITIQTPTAIEGTDHGLPASFELGQNYPNPFNPSTSISFAVPHASRVTIKVFNLLGKEVATLVDQTFAAGRFQTTWDAVDMESGVYFYRMQAEGFVKIRKLLLVQ
ncbi:T9SS type A sorting domain-containing protein, partial [candidate division KSB1 bacterium]|nr:T9SS type A sorting domain-containing protein [candidate division KSB1 bacterium]